MAPILPAGKLLPVSSDARGATFLVLDGAAKIDGVADFWTFEVFDPPLHISETKAVVQGLTHHRIECAKQLQTRVFASGYDEAGLALVVLGALPAGPVTDGTALALVGKALCDGVELPTANVETGHQAALKTARDLIERPSVFEKPPEPAPAPQNSTAPPKS